MKQIVIVLVAAIAVFPLLFLFAHWYVNWVLYQMVGKKQHAVDWILQTGEVPPEWIKGIRFLSKKQKYISMEPDQIQVKGCHIHKLNKLIGFMKVTTLVENEGERKEIIHQLEDVLRNWEMRRFVNEQRI